MQNINSNLQKQNSQLLAEISSLKIQFEEEKEFLGRSHETVLNTHIQRHKTGTESLKKHYDMEIATLNQEVIQTRQETKGLRIEVEKLK